MPTILRNLRINRVASVDKGAGEGVEILLMKRDDDEDDDDVIEKDFSAEQRDAHGRWVASLNSLRDRASNGEANEDEISSVVNRLKADKTLGAGGMRAVVEQHIGSKLSSQTGGSKQKTADYLERYMGDRLRSSRRAAVIGRQFGKREFSADDRKRLADSGAALPDGSYPIESKADLHNAMQAVGRAKDPAKVKAHIRSRAAALGLTDELSDTFKRDVYGEAVQALRKSLAAIVADEAQRHEALTSLDQFDEYLKAQAAGIAADAGSTGEQGGDDEMSAALKKALGLAESATEDDMIKAIAKQQTEIRLAKMSQKHQAYMDKACEGKGDDEAEKFKNKFSAMEPSERDDHMDKNPIEKRLPEEVRKALAKAEENEKILKALQEKDEIATFAKRAVALGLPEAEGETLRKMRNGDSAAADRIETMLKGLAEQVRTGKLFAEFGKSGSANLGDAEAEVNAKADELRKGDPKLTQAQAFSKVYTNPANADLKKRYDAEQIQKRRAA